MHPATEEALSVSEELPRRTVQAIRFAEQYAMIDGSHHKQWVIDQMLRTLLGPHYEGWAMDYNESAITEDYSEWDEGIAP